MAYRISHSDAPEIEPTLIRLWTTNLDMRGDPRDKFRWYYRDNPLGHAVTFLLEHEDRGHQQTVGSCGIGRRRVFVDGRPLTAALFADFTVDKPHRTLMPAMMLQRALCAYAIDTCDFAYAFPNDAAVGIFNRIGLQTVGRARRYVKVLRSAAYLLPQVRLSPVATVMGAVIDQGLRIRDRLVAPLPSGCRAEWTSNVDSRFDALFERVRHRWGIIGERSAEFLRWRFIGRPGLPARVAIMVDRATGELKAYAVVVAKRPGEALVADFLAETPAGATGILGWLGPRLASEGFASAVAYFLGSRAIDGALAAAGFRFRNDAKFVIAGAREGAPAPTGRLARGDDWYLTEADRDN